MSNGRDTGAKDGGGIFSRLLTALGRMLLIAAILFFYVLGIKATLPSAGEQHAEIQTPQMAEADPGRQIDWDSLPETIVAWVEIPGTSIDEPVAQATEERPDYYLYNDALGEGNYGTPYIDWECRPGSSFVSVYGHHMSDGSQFADLANYSDETFAREHATIYWYTRADNRRHELRVIAADVVNASYETQRVAFTDDVDRSVYLCDKLSQCDVNLQEPVIAGRQVFSFSTCSYQTWNSRTVVLASAIESSAYPSRNPCSPISESSLTVR